MQSLDYSFSSEKSIRRVSLCCCCLKLRAQTFLRFMNLIFTISASMAIAAALVLIFRFERFRLGIVVLSIAAVYFLTAILSMLKHAHNPDFDTKFHKWQAIGNSVFCFVLLVAFLTLAIELGLNLGDSKGSLTIQQSLSFEITLLVVALCLPVLGFYIYWSICFLFLVVDRRLERMDRAARLKKAREEAESPGFVV